MSKWRKYQDEAALFFRSLGLTADVDATAIGARGKHAVDVLVTGSAFSLPIKWVVECKAWKTSVPKEKALALQSIVQDVGADKGILLSGVGFQSGALRVAESTNLQLTSIADLRATITSMVAENALSALNWRLAKTLRALTRIHRSQKKSDNYNEYMIIPAIMAKARVLWLEAAFDDALTGEFPIIYSPEGQNGRKAAGTMEELIEGADKLLQEAEAYARSEGDLLGSEVPSA